MPTYVHLVRHAQGFHNLCAANHSLPDPDLTPLGKEQCAALQKTFPFQDRITHLVASPLRRTIYTCLLSFEPAVKTGKRVIALPEVQEVSPLPCDTGSSAEALASEFAEKVDLGLVTEGWNDKAGASPFAPAMDRLEARARKARLWLRELGRQYEREHPGVDAHIVVVTHGGFLHFLTQDWDGMNPAAGTGWANTEWRTYEFVDAKGEDPEASLRETKVSWRRRRGSAQPLTETEQMELRVATKSRMEEEWGGLC
jgi:broad specificity phosphatase PhoE